MVKSKKTGRLIVVICIVALLLFVILPFGLSVYIYQSNFGSRYTTTSWMKRSLDEFDGLSAQQYSFPSKDGQQLIGYKYYRENVDVKGVIVIAHGLGGGGHNSYMDVADYFASSGYLVFAYDATGNDESEGDAVNGIPQGVIDLDYAIRFVKENDDFDNLPIMLFGHSWGAYSAGSVLNIHPDIRAVVMVAGFNKSEDVIEEEGTRIMGSGMRYLVPFISLIERVKFGQYAKYTCMEGFDHSAGNIMIIHSSDDRMISYQNQFVLFESTYQNNARFTFLSYEDRGHDYVYYSDASRLYDDQLNGQFSEYVNSLEEKLSPEIKAAYMSENLDLSKLFDLDQELMGKMVDFFDISGK